MATFSFTLNDAFVPRVTAAYGLTGTPAEMKAQFELELKAWMIARVAASESSAASAALLASLTVEFEASWYTANEKTARASRLAKFNESRSV